MIYSPFGKGGLPASGGAEVHLPPAAPKATRDGGGFFGPNFFILLCEPIARVDSPIKRLCYNYMKRRFVILNEVKNLIGSTSSVGEILRLHLRMTL